MTSPRATTATLLLILCLAIPDRSFGEGDGRKGQAKTSATTAAPSPIRAYLNINNISTVFKNTGVSDIDAQEQNSGLVFPKGSKKTAVFQSGFLWGGVVDSQVRVGGTAYREGLQPGKIISTGVAEDPELAKNRIYRVRPDERPGSGTGLDANVSSEAVDEGLSEAAVRAQYETDWLEWPAADGAPYADLDSNGSYDPAIDVPGVPGADQTIWFVANDLSAVNTQFLYGSLPMGIEMQATIWAYNQEGALGNMFFRKYVIINKSGKTFTDMYTSMWSDIDLGNSTDDFGGCDTTLSLGYVYNANAVDATYRPLPPPAVGFDFFQGPVVDSPGDTAIFNGQYVFGKKNLPMTAFYYFARGDASVTDPTQGSYEGTTQFYNFFQGRIGRTGDFFVDPNTGDSTTFALAGDPVTGSGWVDGDLIPPGDRRIGLASGPFVMADGDTQEVVVAEIVAGAITGVDRLTAITLLKSYDLTAQLAYQSFFNITPPPPAPVVNVIEGDREVTLSWGDDLDAVRLTEEYALAGYKFEGYNVYQTSTSSGGDVKRIATFDVFDSVTTISDTAFDAVRGGFVAGPVQYGEDAGIQRHITISNDDLHSAGKLVNGVKYYFAVTAYGHNPSAPGTWKGVPTTLENPVSQATIRTAVPHSVNPGVVYDSGKTNDVIHAVHASGGGDGSVEPLILDPDLMTGATYTVYYDTVLVDTVQMLAWNLLRHNLDGTTDTVLVNQLDQTGADTSAVIDGMQIKVYGPALSFKNFEVVSNGAGPLVPPEGGAADFGGFPSLQPTTSQQTNGSRWLFHTADANQTRALYDAFLARTARDGDNWPAIIPHDYEMRFTATGSWAFDAYNSGSAMYQVPFELWDIGINTPTDPADDYQLIAWELDNDLDMTYNLSSFGTDIEHSVSGGNNDPFTDWTYWMRPEDRSPGRAGYLAAEAELIGGTYDGARETEVMARTVLVSWNGGAAPPFAAPLPEVGTTWRITSTKPSTPADTFTFTAPKTQFSVAQAQQDIGKINVFPNPYYGVNSEELNKYQRFVTFSHLPPRATIRIFNLAGILVRTIEKDDPEQFQRWDLVNESGLPVASGLYVAYIDMPEIGTTKTVKLSIIQERQILDRF